MSAYDQNDQEALLVPGPTHTMFDQDNTIRTNKKFTILNTSTPKNKLLTLRLSQKKINKINKKDNFELPTTLSIVLSSKKKASLSSPKKLLYE